MLRSTAFLLLVSSLPATALTIELTALPQRVTQHHPELKSARMVIEQAKARQKGAGRLENPTFGAEWKHESQLDPGSATFSLEQSFPITNRLRLEKQLSAQLVTCAELEVRNAERLAVADAQTLAVQVLALQQQKHLRDEQYALTKKLADFVTNRAQAGEISALDAAQTQIDLQRLQVEGLKWESEAQHLIQQLKSMVGLQPTAHLTVSGTLSAPSKSPATVSWQQRPDYQLSLARIEAAEIDKKLALAGRKPDVSAGIFGGPEYQTRSSSDPRNGGFVGIRFSVPLPLWNKNEGLIAEKQSEAERARLESQALAKQIASEAAGAVSDMTAASKLAAELRDKLLPLIAEQASKLEKAYEQGQTDLTSVNRAREQRLTIQTNALDAVRDYHLARVRYESATGTNR